MPVLTHEITEAETGRTVKSIALKEMRLSRGWFSSLKFNGGIRLDGESVRADQRVQAGQILSAQWEETQGTSLTPYEAPLRIPWQDEHYFVIDKPAPLPTLCSARQEGATLENVLFSYLKCPENYLFRPVNRLDKGTSGLMAAAKNAHAAQRLQRQLHTDAFVREYLAVVEGWMAGEGVIDAPIAKADGATVKRGVDFERGRPAVTHYQVEVTGEKHSLVRLRLQTGRTHRIRVHLAHLGHPIAGDFLYGRELPELPGRFALHSTYIRLTHPVTGEVIERESPLPEALAALLEDE